MSDVCLKIDCEQPSATVWERLFSKQGLCARGELSGKQVGERFQIETGAGDVFAGRVAEWEPDRRLALIIENMNLSELHVTTTECSGEQTKTQLEFSLVAVGLHHDEVESFRLRWRLQLSDLFGGDFELDLGWL